MIRKSLLLLAFVCSGGCTYLAATPSMQGRAYVIRNEWVSSSYWNCDATSGEPVCYQTRKHFQPPQAK